MKSALKLISLLHNCINSLSSLKENIFCFKENLAAWTTRGRGKIRSQLLNLLHKILNTKCMLFESKTFSFSTVLFYFSFDFTCTQHGELGFVVERNCRKRYSNFLNFRDSTNAINCQEKFWLSRKTCYSLMFIPKLAVDFQMICRYKEGIK